jgi:hypothetical protein
MAAVGARSRKRSDRDTASWKSFAVRLVSITAVHAEPVGRLRHVIPRVRIPSIMSEFSGDDVRDTDAMEIGAVTF